MRLPARMLVGFMSCVLLTLVSQASETKGVTKMAIFTKEAEFSVAGKERDAGAVAWSPDGSQLAVLATLLRYATVFAVPSGDKLATITDLVGGSRSIAFAADGRVVIPSHQDDSAAVAIWDPKTGSTMNVAGPDPRSRGAVNNSLFEFALDPAATRLAGVHYLKSGQLTSFHVAVYDAQSWTLIADHVVNAGGPAMSPDGSRAAMLGPGGSVYLVDLQTGEIRLEINANILPVKELAWSVDSKRIASGSIAGGFGRIPGTDKYGPLRDDNVLQLWDAISGRRIAVAGIDVGGGVESLDFSSNGRWLVTTTSDGTCRLWDAATLEPIETIATGLHPTTALARFSPDSTRLAVIRTGRALATIYRRR